MLRFTLAIDIEMVTTTPRFTKHLFCVSLIRKSNKQQYHNNENKKFYRAVPIIPKPYPKVLFEKINPKKNPTKFKYSHDLGTNKY